MTYDLPQPTLLQEIRTGKMRPLGTVTSGIDKQCREGRLYVSPVGLPDDEHDLTFHGGPDKAIHQYCSENYAKWQQMYPDASLKQKFVPGAFGENLVASGLSEHNVCAGDLVRIGPPGTTDIGGKNGCVLEVSLPRQPCFKLNQRFGIKNFAPVTHQLAMTGWYYRVKNEGWIAPGMEISIIERRHPQWTISRLHTAVHREKDFTAAMQELIEMEELGDECKDVFVKKRQKQEDEERRKRLPAVVYKKFELISRTSMTSQIVRLDFKSRVSLLKTAAVSPGSSVLIKLPNGLMRAYSVVRGTTDCFSLGVARDVNSRGGSEWLHDSFKIGDSIEVGEFSQNLSLHPMASHHIFVVGGIGITAFLAMMDRLQETNRTFELHNCVRSDEATAFAQDLKQYGENMHIYDKSKGQRLDIEDMLRNRTWNSHVYVCGPQRMIDGTLEAAQRAGMHEEEVHYEQFSVDASGDPFTCEVEGQLKCVTLQVKGQQSLLEAMRETGLEVPSSCETGSCGTCRIPLLKGRVNHKGTFLTAAEREQELLSCVSRGIGHIVVGSPGI